MGSLDTDLRNLLENTIRETREIAETAARVAIDQMAISDQTYHPHLNETEKELRRILRAHGRQLGDQLKHDGTQTIDFLVEKVAYEHWHRMLFARFLAENQLLIHPELLVPVTIEECDDLALSQGLNNGWELASQYATQMLPQIFRTDSPVFRLELSPEYQRQLERSLDNLPVDIFTATDSLGWVYQFWQSKKKNEVNKSEIQIGARELPAVTQLFTEPYMVRFLLDNSIGAWWTKKKLDPNDYTSSENECEIRKKIVTSGFHLEYLRFTQDESKVWSIAGGKFEDWPQDLSEFKMLDPCCGSGHFLVATLDMLVPMRMELENLSATEAVDLVLRDNIHGLEIDQRCVEIAAFALALAAWKYPGTNGYRALPELNLACSGLSINIKKEDWLKLAGKNANLKIALGQLFNQFTNAHILGSLIELDRKIGEKTLIDFDWATVHTLIKTKISEEKEYEMKINSIAAHGLLKAAQILAERYHLVSTNVPYLGRKKQNEFLQRYSEDNYPDSKQDLATVFMERCLRFTTKSGLCCLVLPQNWTFLNSYSNFRYKMLKKYKWNVLAKLGPGAFNQITGEVVQAILLIIEGPTHILGEHHIKGIDVSEYPSVLKKKTHLIKKDIIQLSQINQITNPDSIIIVDEIDYKHQLLEIYAKPVEGAKTIDINRFRHYFWELKNVDQNWNLHNSSPKGEMDFDGLHYVSINREPNGPMATLVSSYESEGRKVVGWLCGKGVWGKRGIAVSWMNKLPSSLYVGSVYDNSVAVFEIKDEMHFPAVYCYLRSSKYVQDVRKINQKIQVATRTLGKVPFNLDHWSDIAKEKYPNGLPQPYSNDPTQWIFHGHPSKTVIWNSEIKDTAHGPHRIDEMVLQITVARLLGYLWPMELNDRFELSIESHELISDVRNLKKFTDTDGIVCIPPLKGELGADERLEVLLSEVYGDKWTSNTVTELLACADCEGKSIETWLRDKFFSQHCKIFRNRPFIWQIWDGTRDGFSALINYHKLDTKLLETLIYTYLGDWISQQQQEIASGVDGAEERLAAAEVLKQRLELILEGESPYDIFVRWKSLADQTIGWNPDLNDGIRLNIRPFMMVPDISRKGAGVLRDKPKINWNKDRGKDIKSAPWFDLGTEYGGKSGDRINNHHLKLSQKTSKN
jgi:hypothetical protein